MNDLHYVYAYYQIRIEKWFLNELMEFEKKSIGLIDPKKFMTVVQCKQTCEGETTM